MQDKENEKPKNPKKTQNPKTQQNITLSEQF